MGGKRGGGGGLRPPRCLVGPQEQHFAVQSGAVAHEKSSGIHTDTVVLLLVQCAALYFFLLFRRMCCCIGVAPFMLDSTAVALPQHLREVEDLV